MSSLSQEDLDAGWDTSDAVGTDSQKAVPGNAQSVPPNSITLEKPNGSRESLVVPAGSRRSTSSIHSRAIGFASVARTLGSPPDEPALTAAAQEDAEEPQPEIAERAHSSVVSSSTLGWASAHRRAIWLAAAILGFILGILGFRLKAHRSLNRLSTTVMEQGQLRSRGPAITAARGFEQVASAVPSDTRRASEQKGITPSESFSDAFLKHAATANSSWSEVKKRPRPAAPSTPKRPDSNASPSNDDPLNVLDQLEKARKAKKQAPSMP